MFSVLHFWHFPPPNVMSLFRKPKKSFLCRVKEFNLDLSQNFFSFWLRYISETHFRLCQREHLKMGYFEHNLKVRWKDESLFWVYSAVRVFPFMPKTKKKNWKSILKFGKQYRTSNWGFFVRSLVQHHFQEIWACKYCEKGPHGFSWF